MLPIYAAIRATMTRPEAWQCSCDMLPVMSSWHPMSSLACKMPASTWILMESAARTKKGMMMLIRRYIHGSTERGVLVTSRKTEDELALELLLPNCILF